MVRGCESRSAGPAEAPRQACQTADKKKKSDDQRPFAEVLHAALPRGRGPKAPDWIASDTPQLGAPCPGARGDARESAAEAPAAELAHEGRQEQLTALERDEVVEPLMCSLAVLQPRAASPVLLERAPIDPAVCAPWVSKIVRRLSWGGDGRRGVARIEVGAGALAGATLLVTAEGGEISVEVDLPAGAAADGWAQRLGAALEARGVRLSGIDIR